MSAHKIASDLYMAPGDLADPGNAGQIVVERSPCLVNLVSAGVETRTLPRPTRSGALVTLAMRTDGGDITVTITGGSNEDGDTTFVFSDVGQFAMFQSFMTSTGVFFWRLISHYGIGNLTPAEAAAASSAGGAANVVGVAAGYKIARGATALDGTNPTPVVTGLATVVAAVVSLEGAVAPGLGTSVLTLATTNYATGALSVLAWKPTSSSDPTLIASTGTETFEWIAIGT